MLLRQTTPLKLFAKANNNITAERNNDGSGGKYKEAGSRGGKATGKLPVGERAYRLCLNVPTDTSIDSVLLQLL